METAYAGQFPSLTPSAHKQFNTFRQAARVQTSLLADLEKKTLLSLAAHTPACINSDHLTALALTAMLGAGATFWFARWHPWALWLTCLFLALNWLGDSLDGTLARYRNRQRPRYGFYIDHVVDAVGAAALLGGLGLSGYMSPAVAAALLVSYLLLMIEVSIATYTLGTFQISFFALSPTELRIILAIGNLALLRSPVAHVFGQELLLFDIGGVIGTAGMIAIFLISATRNGLQLYREERLT